MNSTHLISGAKPPGLLQVNGGLCLPPLRQVIDPIVALAFSVDMHELRARKRGSSRVAFARQVSMYLAHVACGLSLTDVGGLYGRDRSTVAHACCVIEDQRDDSELDMKLDHLERAIVELVSALAWYRRPR